MSVRLSPGPLLLLGCGYSLARLVERRRVVGPLWASTRDAGRRAWLQSRGVEGVEQPLELLRAHRSARVIVSLPPDAGMDARLAEGLRENPPQRLVYLSSTGVYGRASGVVSEATPVESGLDGPGRARCVAESLYLSLGGVALRLAGIYGPGRGLHRRLAAGTYRLPGDGSGRISRIHVDDVCAAIETVLEAKEPGTAFNVADDAPVPQREAVEWLCGRLKVPFPPSVPLEFAPPTLRGDRQVDNSRLKALGWRPRYPTYQEGFSAVLAEEATSLPG